MRLCPPESCSLSNTTFPHILPLLSLLEKCTAMGDGTEPWETVDVGVDVVMFHLGAARTIAQLGGIYRSNAESKLQGKRGRTLFGVGCVLDQYLSEGRYNCIILNNKIRLVV